MLLESMPVRLINGYEREDVSTRRGDCIGLGVIVV